MSSNGNLSSCWKSLPAIILCVAIVVTSLSLPVVFERQVLGDENASLSSYVPHAPIQINGNSDLVAQASSNGWPGSGTPVDPYVISGYYINGTDNRHSIWIMNTTLGYAIESCLLEAWGCKVVEFSNTSGGALRSNTMVGHLPTVSVTNGSSGTVIFNNTIENGGMIDVRHGHGCTISNNTLVGVESPVIRCAIRVGAIPFDPPSDDMRIENNTISNYTFCIGAEYTNLCGVRWNNLADTYCGVEIEHSPNATVSGNTVRRANDGIALRGSTTSTVSDNSVGSVSRSAIRIRTSTGITLHGNLMTDGGLLMEGSAPAHWNSHAIDASNTVSGFPVSYLLNASDLVIEYNLGQAILVSSTNITLRGQLIANATSAVSLAYSNRTTLEDLQMTDNSESGITAIGCADIVVANCSVRNSIVGLSLSTSARANISDCSFFGKNESLEGLSVSNSNNCSVYRCNVSMFRHDGILFENSADAVASGCNVSMCGVGVEVSSKRCHVTGNQIVGNSVGVMLDTPSNYASRIDNNTLVGNGFALGHDPSTWVGQAIEQTNSVNGRQLLYGQMLVGGTVPADYGQIILANCTEVTISDYNLTNDSAGILLYGSTGTTISNSSVDGNMNGNLTVESWDFGLSMSMGTIITYGWDVGGVVLVGSSDTHIESSALTNNARGVYLYYGSDRNSITGCVISSNEYGVVVEYDSTDNTISYCNISMNSNVGLKLSWSFWDSIHHNVFYQNNGAGAAYDPLHSQAWADSWPNYWNSTSGGNYWSDWTAPDDNHDGIVDAAYPIISWDGNIIDWDYLPLTSAPPEVIPGFSDGSVVLLLIGLVGIASTRLIKGRRRGG